MDTGEDSDIQTQNHTTPGRRPLIRRHPLRIVAALPVVSAPLLLLTALAAQSMASAAPGAIPLALHQPVDRTIALRQADTLRIELPPDHYALVVVTTAAGSLEGTLVAPDGSSVVQAASRVFRVGGIPFSVHADAAGVATLQVLCSGGDRCRYSAVLDAVRPWDDEAAMQMRGERALIDGEDRKSTRLNSSH